MNLIVSRARPEILQYGGAQPNIEPPHEIEAFDITRFIRQYSCGSVLNGLRLLWCAPIISAALLGLTDDDFDQYLKCASISTIESERLNFWDLVLECQVLQALHGSMRRAVTETPYSRGVRLNLDKSIFAESIDLHAVECGNNLLIGPQDPSYDILFLKMLRCHGVETDADSFG